MRFKSISLICILTSCSTLKKTIVVSSLVGASIGATGGFVFSPDKDSTNKNAYLFGVAGGLVGAGIAYLLDDSRAKQMTPMILEDQPKQQEKLPLFDFAPDLKDIRPEVNFQPIKKYEVPLEKLPPELEGKVKKQFLIEYQSEPRTIEINNKTIEIGPFKAWEHIYEK